jgi:N-acetylneuraminic acid mutarotase
MMMLSNNSADSAIRPNPASDPRPIFGRFGCARFLPIAAIFILVAGLLSPLASAQSGQWVWMGGSSSSNQAGSYGPLGSTISTNFPGSRSGATTWTDSNGNFWLFGGVGYDSNGVTGILNDLWEFNPSTQLWTWVSGSNAFGTNPFVPGVYGLVGQPDPLNMPGGRSQAGSWVDSSGNLWLFGGQGTFSSTDNSVQLNDLWEFNPTNSVWTWWGGTEDSPVSSPVPTIPAARFGPYSWSDASGNFWLFGGQTACVGCAPGDSCPSCFLNDLWQFNPTTQQWTLMSGSANGVKKSGIYGVLGFDAPANYPGNRASGLLWTDSSGEEWLFGGSGIDKFNTVGFLNDLWRYNPSDEEWAWMSGDTFEGFPFSLNNFGVSTYWASNSSFGTPGLSTVNGHPGGRLGATNWIDPGGNLWLFGGSGLDGIHQYGSLNELWEYNPPTHQWAWVGGLSHVGSNGFTPGVFGSLDTPSPGSIPSGRANASSWIDSSGNVWLFGGGAVDASSNTLAFNDLWEFQLPATVAEPTFDLPAGPYSTVQTVHISDTTPGAKIYYTTDGKMPNTSTTLYTGPITVSTIETLRAIAVGTYLSTSPLASALYTVTPPAPTPVITPAPGTYTTPQVVHIAESLIGASIYYTTDGTPPSTSSTPYTASFTLSANANVQAIAIWPGFNTQSLTASAAINIAPVAITPVISPVAGTYFTTQSVTILDKTPGAVIYYTTDTSTPTTGSNVYSGAISVASNQTIRAAAIAPGGTISAIASNAYTITTAPLAPTPVITPAPGTYTTPQVVHIGESLIGASIYYTTNGSDPSASSTLYTASFTLSANATVKAIAIKAGTNSPSLIASAAINIAPVAITPVISPVAGTYFTTQSVTILDKTPGAVIYYTTDTSTPTTGSNVYSGAISVASSQTIRAAAIAPGGTISAIASNAYTITTAPPAPMPSISPASGPYTGPINIHLADSLVGAQIYYTTDGSDPTTGSTLYTGSFQVRSSGPVKAIAIKPGANSASPEASASYTIN